MTESMSILAAPTTQMADHPLLMFLAVLLFIGPVVSVAIGKMIGVFRHPGIVGPDRLEETESPLALFGMLLFAIVGYILVSGLYARAVAGGTEATTQPAATQSITTPTPAVSE